MNKVVLQFRNGRIAEYKTNGDIYGLKVKGLGNVMLKRYAHIEAIKCLLKNNAYFSNTKYANAMAVRYFDTLVLYNYRIDGRSKEARALPYFSIEECLKNY